MTYKPKIDRKVEVVKVQRLVFQAGGVGGPSQPPILIYDAKRQHQVNMEWGDLPEWLHNALQVTPKLFVRAVWTGAAWEFVGQKQAAWQSW